MPGRGWLQRILWSAHTADLIRIGILYWKQSWWHSKWNMKASRSIARSLKQVYRYFGKITVYLNSLLDPLYATKCLPWMNCACCLIWVQVMSCILYVTIVWLNSWFLSRSSSEIVTKGKMLQLKVNTKAFPKVSQTYGFASGSEAWSRFISISRMA